MTAPKTGPSPCPFDGFDAPLVCRVGSDALPGYRVHCPGCSANGPEALTKDEAISAWNRRSLPALDAVVKALEDLMEAMDADLTIKRGPASPYPFERKNARAALALAKGRGSK